MSEPIPAAAPAAALKPPAPPTRPRGQRLLIIGSFLLLLAAPKLLPGSLDSHVQQYWLGLLAKFMALAILALSVDLVWGYSGLLSLGQGIFFGLGAYLIAYSLTLHSVAADKKRPIGKILEVAADTGQVTLSVRDPADAARIQGPLTVFRRLPDRSEKEIGENLGGLRKLSGDAESMLVEAADPDLLRELRPGDTVKRAMLPGEVAPGFMQYTGLAPNDPNYVPPPGLALIAPLADIRVAIAAMLLLPCLVAGLFGWVFFRLRVRGVYFALVTQALLLAVFTTVRNQQRFTGGVVGIKDLADLKLLGQTFDLQKNIHATIYLVAGALCTCALLSWLIMQSKYGRILTAIRENEYRVLSLGYNTALYKTSLFAFAGLLAGLAGGLYVIANHPVCDTDYLSISFSIEAVIWVAVGGRGNLIGAVLGALLIGFGQSYISSALADFWPIVLGALFVLVVLFLPNGLSSVAGRGALLGLLLGVYCVIYLENFPFPGTSVKLLQATDELLNFRRAGRIFIGCPVIILMVFLPRATTLAVQYLARRTSQFLHPRASTAG